MESQELFPSLSDDQVQLLEQAGFSCEQIAVLFRVKMLYQRDVYNEATSEYKRQAFVRWLYLQGRLES